MQIKTNWAQAQKQAEAEREASKVQVLPIGTFVCKIEEVKDRVIERTGQVELSIKFVATKANGQDEGKVVSKRIYMFAKIKGTETLDKSEYSSNALTQIKEIAELVGFKFPEGEFNFDANNLVGKFVKVKTKFGKEYINKDGDKIVPIDVAELFSIKPVETAQSAIISNKEEVVPFPEVENKKSEDEDLDDLF